uniref:Reverse transcriptase domain-containing protein n=1 Tax=Heterosigma akashiwo TaxID=2829 RepID=A0A7S3Y2F4_HETAK
MAAAVAAGRLGIPLLDPTTVDTAVAALAEAQWGAFQAATPLKRRKSWKKAVPWWTPELSALKVRFRRARKKRRRSAQHEEEFQRERLAFNRAMRTAKRRSWRKFCSGEKQPFGRVYKVLKGRGSNPISTIRGPDGVLISDPEQSVATLLDNFFPDKAAEVSEDATVAAAQESVERQASQFENWCRLSLPDDDDGPFTTFELRREIFQRGGYKAPGPDMIIGRVLKECIDEVEPHLASVTNACRDLGYFPRGWKVEDGVACAKPGKKDYTLMKAYRLLALLCAASKILEGMITSRVSWRAERGSWFHEHAYGFRPDRNKDGAVEELVTRAERAIHRGRVLVAVFFDVDGAFNQSWHPAVLTALQEKGCPPGLFCLISSFLRERQCNLNVNGFSASKLLRLGFPQGGVGPPIYWTTHNNRVAVYVEVGGEALFIGYADDNGFTVEGGPDELGALVELAWLPAYLSP